MTDETSELPAHVRAYRESTHPAKTVVREALDMVRRGIDRDVAADWLLRVAPGSFTDIQEARDVMESEAGIAWPA